MNQPKSGASSNNILVVLLIVALAVIGALVYLVVQPDKESVDSVVDQELDQDLPPPPVMEEPEIIAVEVFDAIARNDISASEGQRYKVRISDQARDGTSGITRIGGLVTFVPDTRVGDVAIVEVVELKRTTADAVVVELLERGSDQVAREERRDERPREEEQFTSSQQDEGLTGQTFRGKITDVGREGDGVTYVNGKVVFVAGAKLGEDVEFRITEDRERFAVAVVTGGPAEPEDKANKYVAPVSVGEEYEVVISEADRRSPEKNGVTRIQNMVVFVPDTRVGERVRIRVTDLQKRAADAVVIERLGSSDP